MNIVIVSHELPFPANHGFRIDVYNRILAFKRLNHKVFLVAWTLYDDNKSSESVQHMRGIVDGLICFSRKEDLFSRSADIVNKVCRLFQQPSVVTQCSVKGKRYRNLAKEIKSFKPDAVFVESIYSGKLALKLCAENNAPLFIRSHNIEHLYVKNLVRNSTTFLSGLKYSLMGFNLKKYEHMLLAKADGFFDISLSDLKYWKEAGLERGHWMPPVLYRDERQDGLPAFEAEFDIAYIGNLSMPNNLEGVYWLLNTALPEIRKVNPNIKILIAGSKPSHEVVDFCGKYREVTLISNAPDVRPFYTKSRVIVNPILSGSGVNIKTVEMLSLARQVVCTGKAVEGLPDAFKEIFRVCGRDAMPYEIAKALSDDSVIDSSSRNSLLGYFDENYFTKSVEIMEQASNRLRGTSGASRLMSVNAL